jgi:hypothetical protein
MPWCSTHVETTWSLTQGEKTGIDDAMCLSECPRRSRPIAQPLPHANRNWMRLWPTLSERDGIASWLQQAIWMIYANPAFALADGTGQHRGRHLTDSSASLFVQTGRSL